MKIKPIGNYLSQDENGFIVNDLSIEQIDKKWLPILETIVEIYQAKLGENLVSIYVRGSVARNLAVDGVSDLDTFALVKSTFFDERIRWQTADFQLSTFQEINNEYSFFCDLEMNLATFDAASLSSNLGMIIKTQSLLLFGQDIAKQIKNYKADEAMMLNKHWLATDLVSFLAIEQTDFELRNCQETMKLILRSGFELVMKRVGKYSPDLYICYRDFSKYYPQKSTEMRQVLDWFLNPILDKKVLDDFVNTFGKWLLRNGKIITYRF